MKANSIRFLILFLLFSMGIWLSLCYGGSQGPPSSFSSADFIFWNIRLPKTISAILAGASLSCAGLILQVLFRNPLAGPYVLGISSGASLTVALTILGGNAIGIFSNFFLGRTVLVISAVSGSLAITFLILVLSRTVRSNVVLLLIGLMISQICGAVQGALEYFANPNDLKSFVIWGMGSLSNTTNPDLLIYLPVAFVFLLLVLLYIKPLNALLLGENYAQNAGINYKQSRLALILISSVLTGITTAFCGPIAFVGIAVPLLSRMIFSSSSQQVHVFSCLLIGSILLLFSDLACHTILKPSTLPVNMITTLIGAPIVIYLLFKNKNW